MFYYDYLVDLKMVWLISLCHPFLTVWLCLLIILYFHKYVESWDYWFWFHWVLFEPFCNSKSWLLQEVKKIWLDPSIKVDKASPWEIPWNRLTLKSMLEYGQAECMYTVSLFKNWQFITHYKPLATFFEHSNFSKRKSTTMWTIHDNGIWLFYTKMTWNLLSWHEENIQIFQLFGLFLEQNFSCTTTWIHIPSHWWRAHNTLSH